MKKIILATVASASLLGATFAALAAEAQGVIESIDPATGTVILQDGSTWTAAEGVDVTELAPGDAIMVTYEDGTTVITSVEKL